MTEQPFVRLGLWRPWQHCGVTVPLANSILNPRIHANMNGSSDDVSLGSVSDSYTGVILERVIGFGIVVYRIG